MKTPRNLAQYPKKAAGAVRASRRLQIISIAAVLVVLGSGTATGVRLQAQKSVRIAQERQLKADNLQKKQQAQTLADARQKQAAAAKTQDTPPTAPATGQTPQQSSSPSQQPIKYATSSDPRSTAYSLTPPAPNPASFN